jgi:hypothetical protein
VNLNVTTLAQRCPVRYFGNATIDVPNFVVGIPLLQDATAFLAFATRPDVQMPFLQSIE